MTAASVLAHDLWIVPGQFATRPGEKVRVFINSGDTFPASDSLISADRIESLAFRSGSSAELPIAELVTDGKSLTAEIATSEPGIGVLVLALRPRLIRLKAEEFNRYLEEEGFTELVALRQARGESGEPAVERYTKWAKAIVSIGDGRGDRWSQAAGLKLEIVPLAPPHAWTRGATFPVEVRFEGKPLPAVPVVGGRAGTPAHRVRTVTDDSGEARVTLERAGRWYLRALHMIRLQDDPEATWESFWTTLTFEVQT